MVKIAVTGGIGAGKSSLCRFFENRGNPVISADRQARKALSKNSPLYPSLLKLFHKKSNESLCSKEIAQQIFSNKGLKQQFESIVHPYIFECIQQEEKKFKKSSHIFYEIPLLFETHSSSYFNWIILVICSKKSQKERIIKKLRLSEKSAQRRINSQESPEKKIEKSDLVIENNGTLIELEQKAEEILNFFNKGGEFCSKK